MFEQFSNGNGTYNGIKALAAWSGLSMEEVAWTAARMQQLIKVDKLPIEAAKAQVAAEAKQQPWLKEKAK